MRRVLLPLAVVLASAAPAAAPVHAQQVNAPPGLSGVDEYLETVPGAGGAERPGGGSGPDGAPAEGEVEAKTDAAIPAETVRELGRRGEDGARVARLAATNAPVEPSRSGRGAEDRGAVKGQALRDEGGSSAAGAIPAVLTGSTGAGLVFPLTLVTLTLVLAVAAVRRRRTA